MTLTLAEAVMCEDVRGMIDHLPAETEPAVSAIACLAVYTAVNLDATQPGAGRAFCAAVTKMIGDTIDCGAFDVLVDYAKTMREAGE